MYRTQAIIVRLGVSEVDLIRRQFLAYGTASEKENTISSQRRDESKKSPGATVIGAVTEMVSDLKS
jgi:hypothetical protein